MFLERLLAGQRHETTFRLTPRQTSRHHHWDLRKGLISTALLIATAASLTWIGALPEIKLPGKPFTPPDQINTDGNNQPEFVPYRFIDQLKENLQSGPLVLTK